MSAQLDLLTYPRSPGYKDQDTSRLAALSISGRAATLRDACLRALTQQAMTADEVASVLKESILSIRPRISELNKLGLIERTAARGKTASGNPAVIWRAAAR